MLRRARLVFVRDGLGLAHGRYSNMGPFGNSFTASRWEWHVVSAKELQEVRDTHRGMY